MGDAEAADVDVAEGLAEGVALAALELEPLGEIVAVGEALLHGEVEAEPESEAGALALAEVEPEADTVAELEGLGYRADSHRTFVTPSVATAPVAASTAV